MFTIIRKETKKWEKSNIMIRLEKKEEHQKVENLVRDSFSCVKNLYRVILTGLLESMQHRKAIL